MNLNEITHNPNARVVQKFRYNGLECVVLNIRERYYCGYVRTPFDGHHEDFEDVLDVHGGLTYGLDDDGWLGFDTMSGYDVAVTALGMPLTNNPVGDMLKQMDDSREWDPEDVITETERLAAQVSELVPKGTLPEDEGEILE